MGTVFIAIDKCDQENGCLKVHVRHEINVLNYAEFDVSAHHRC